MAGNSQTIDGKERIQEVPNPTSINVGEQSHFKIFGNQLRVSPLHYKNIYQQMNYLTGFCICAVLIMLCDASKHLQISYKPLDNTIKVHLPPLGGVFLSNLQFNGPFVAKQQQTQLSTRRLVLRPGGRVTPSRIPQESILYSQLGVGHLSRENGAPTVVNFAINLHYNSNSDQFQVKLNYFAWSRPVRSVKFRSKIKNIPRWSFDANMKQLVSVEVDQEDSALKHSFSDDTVKIQVMQENGGIVQLCILNANKKALRDLEVQCAVLDCLLRANKIEFEYVNVKDWHEISFKLHVRPLIVRQIKHTLQIADQQNAKVSAMDKLVPQQKLPGHSTRPNQMPMSKSLDNFGHHLQIETRLSVFDSIRTEYQKVVSSSNAPKISRMSDDDATEQYYEALTSPKASSPSPLVHKPLNALVKN
ncbi:hypothetical protein MP228_002867 [Amoeboaphelidium protococcarum]|nr:hypothetical protein MP228_002867 [Amoeboaphelidium protococcarum]